MTFSLTLNPLIVFALSLTQAGMVAAQDGSGSANEKEFTLGVQTHFAQGWNTDALALLPGLGTTHIRDEVEWDDTEQQAGVYDVNAAAPFMAEIRSAGIDPLVLFIGSNPHHDGGQTPHTDAGRAAFARYVKSVLDAYPELIKQIEIGNEYNTDAVDGPFREDNAYHTGMLIKAVVPVVKAAHPEVTILCTGAHSVATGYFRGVFETGALAYCDGISFHPYRDEPENLDAEIERLRALIREFGGGAMPLYVTEFGKWFEDPVEAPDFLLKMVSLMGASGISAAYWYALFNEEWYPNMGLYSEADERMPAADAFRFVQEALLSLGRPVSKGTRGEDHLYVFGQGRTRAFVAWGAPGNLSVTGAALYFDSAGNPIDPVTQLSARPVVISGDDIDVSITREGSVYSAFLGYGSPPWSYLALKPDGEEVPFQVIDWNWNPYHGDSHHNPMQVTPTSVNAAQFGGAPFYTVERFTAPVSGDYEITAHWYREEPEADGADIRLQLDGEVLAQGLVNETPFSMGPVSVTMRAGESLDFAVGPHNEPGGDWVRRDILIKGP